MRWSWKREVFPLGALAILAVFAFSRYASLPDPMPSHFDAEGNVNGWMGKEAFMEMMAILCAGLYLLVTFIPVIDPLWRRVQVKYGLILLVRDVVLGFLVFAFILTIVAAGEGHLHYELMGVGLGLLLVFLGNYMPKLPQNWFIGIRTPWTLSSPVIWKKAHLVGGWLFAVCGLAFIVCSLLVLPVAIPMACLIAVSIFSGIIYPLYLFRKLPKEGES